MNMLGSLVFSVAFSVVAGTCPPQGFDSTNNFDLASFASKPWYIQQQAVTTYLPKEQNYCVSAEYTVLNKKTLLGYDIKVHNIAHEQDGKIHDSGDLIYAKVVDAKSGKLEVAPYFLPTVASGAYWVIDYDESQGYALISGGAPTVPGEGGLCRTGTGVNGAGLWIFTRQQTRSEDLVQKVRGIAETKGFDLTVLNDVDQSNCSPLFTSRGVTATSSVVDTTCPPKGFDSTQTFDLPMYASKPWYIQQQAVTAYLPKNQNYCVSAEYIILAKKTFLGYDIKVHNVAYEQNGKIHDSGDLIYAKIVDAKTGKLEVAPSFLPAPLSGAYWIIDYDESQGYALVSGGAPTVAGEGGFCRTGTGVNGAGLWIFTRQQTRNENLIQKVRRIAETKGFDLTVLNDVDQSSCPPLLASFAVVV